MHVNVHVSLRMSVWYYTFIPLTNPFRPITEPETNPYAGYQLAYEVKKLMYALILSLVNTFIICANHIPVTDTSLNDPLSVRRPTSRGSGTGAQAGTNGVTMPAGIADDQSKDFDFEKTEMKYDSTGMFHWSPARNLEDCILVGVPDYGSTD